MRHNILVEGLGFRLRPVADTDAPLLLALRSDPVLNRYLHSTPPTLASQLDWLAAYYERPGDYYFVVERRSDDAAEGVLSLYDMDVSQTVAEWGRWILRRHSLAAVESAELVYRCAFEQLSLKEVYCRTVASNTQVVAFHDSCRCASRRVLPDHFMLGNEAFDAVEHRVDRDNWNGAVKPYLGRLSERIAARLTHDRS
ncbi:GNAT family N-acetyltransferase [Pusillimonas sp. SM2304]|uniref:GNAT family N-acetyltransferase n=1 Tax=Pusillimonas sp. SM2304 TaxID=3073241 RepID=UPI0028769AF4|nr:GNAT family N-acetyltransferase [Pusillimonas sp. SM2304]MDS1141167.1 GNAT family N-acetyltransferase [Pusillimonas sp. SM2304]